MDKREDRLIRLTLAIALIALICVLVPMMLAARYNFPSADDFRFGAETRRVLIDTGSFLAVIGEAARVTADTYMTWQGSFTGIFLMALQPAIFGEGAYWVTTPIMLIFLIGGVFFLFCTLFPLVLGMRRDVAAIAAALTSIILTQLLPSPVQSFYWYNGSVYYTLIFGVALITLAVGIRLIKFGGWARQLTVCVLCVFIGGGNLVTALSMCVLGACALALGAILRDRRTRRLILPFILLVAALAINAAAPGNAVRQLDYSDTPGAVEAVLLSLRFGAMYLVEFFNLPLLGALICLAPFFLRAACASEFSFRLPGLVSIWSYGLFSSMFCPPIYAMNSLGGMRIVNILFFAYVILLIINLAYWLGWLVRRFDAVRAHCRAITLTGLIVLGIIFGAGCLGGLLTGASFSAVSALSSIRSGEAAAYRAECEARLVLLNDSTVSDVCLPPLSARPYVLFFDDITPDPTDWRNESLAKYYGKDSVTLEG